MTIRETLVAAVTAAAPAGTRVLPYQDNVDVLDVVAIMFKQLGMRPLEAAPRAAFRVNYVLTIVSAAADPAVSEAELDEYVPSLLADLNALDWFAWESAEKVLGPGGIGLAYDVTCWTIAQATELASPLTPSTPNPRKRRASNG
jgi:hypothetical protein